MLTIRFSTFAFVACLVFACSSKGSQGGKDAVSNPQTAAGPALSVALFSDLDVTQMDRDLLLSEISKMKTAARNDDTERAFLARFESEVNSWGDLANDGEAQKRASSLLTLLRYLISAGPQDFESQLQASSKLLQLSYIMQNLEMDFRPIRDEAIEATKLLVRKFPKHDRAHAQLGHVLLTTDETKAERARAEFETCLELNSGSTYCRDYLSRLASQ